MLGFREKSANHKKKAKQFQLEQPLNFEKHTFYQTKNVVAQSAQQDELNPEAFVKLGKGLKNVIESQDQDKLLKELSYTKRELIQAKQALQNLEEGQLTIDNK